MVSKAVHFLTSSLKRMMQVDQVSAQRCFVGLGRWSEVADIDNVDVLLRDPIECFDPAVIVPRTVGPALGPTLSKCCESKSKPYNNLLDFYDQDYAWIIEAGSLIGQIRLDRVDLRDRRANLAIGIEDRGQLGIGLGTEAMVLVLGYAFNVLKLHRLSVGVVDYNLRAIRAYQKCGFVVEGSEREAAFVDGARHDDVMMAILDREYTAIQRSKA
jgi:hypothetical protein